MSIKILDNTVLSVSLNNINSIDLLEKCMQRYNLATSQEVYEESEKGFDIKILEQCFKRIIIHDLRNDIKYNMLLDYLIRRYPYLHKGELSSFLIALLIYKLKGKSYYYVTDDGKMRKTLNKIIKNKEFLEKLNATKMSFNATGTIGLIKRLKEKGILTKKEIECIYIELENSTFRATPELLRDLMGSEKCN